MADLKSGHRMVALYARVSTEQQASEGNSLDSQAKRLRQIAELRFPGIPFELFSDVGSGRGSRRPEFVRMRREMRLGNVRAIVCMAIDRLWRNTREGLRFVEELQGRDCALVLWGSGIDTGTPFGRCFISVMLSFAELESDMIGARVKTAHLANLEKGRKGPGCRPFGWTMNEERELIPDEREQGFIDFVASEREKNVSWNQLARAGARLGIMGVMGRPFSAQSLRSCIDSALHRRARGIKS